MNDLQVNDTRKWSENKLFEFLYKSENVKVVIAVFVG